MCTHYIRGSVLYALLMGAVVAGCLGPGATTRIPIDARRIVEDTTHNQPQQIAFERILEWGTESYNFPADAISRADAEKGVIIFKEFAVVRRPDAGLESIGYTLRMDVRDQRVRFTFVIGDPNSVALTTENDGVAMRSYFDYLKARIMLAIERDYTY